MTDQIRSAYLYVIDSLRYDHVGSNAGGISLTPHLDSLTADGVRFTNAVAQATWSKPSAAAILTGMNPVALGMFPRGVAKKGKSKKTALPTNITTLASLLHQEGFRTAAFSSNIFVSDRFGLHKGIAEMPDMYAYPAVLARDSLNRGIRQRFNRIRVPAIATGAELNSALFDHQRKAASSQFTLIWSMDTHAPFFDRYRIDELDPGDSEIFFMSARSSQNKIDLAREIYTKMVRFADEQVGALVNWLKERGEYRDSLIIVTADHGENFGEHGIYGHAGFPYENQIHVPLIAKLPGDEFAGRIHDELVAHTDILPTFADLYEIPLAQPVHGRSLIPIMRKEAEGHEYQVVYDQTNDDHWEYIGVRTRTAKYMRRERLSIDNRGLKNRIANLARSVADLSQEDVNDLRIDPAETMGLKNRIANLARSVADLSQEEVYDLRFDPAETRNLFGSEEAQPVIEHASEAFETYLANCREYFDAYIGEVSLVNVDRRVQQRLADLGYLD